VDAPKEPLRVRDIVALYLKNLESRVNVGDFSRSAYDDSVRELGRFLLAHGAKPLSECRKHDLTKWLEDHPGWRSAWTRRRILGVITRPFLWAIDQGVIESSPYRAPKKMRKGRKRRPATQAEYVCLMRGGSRELRRALFFLRRTGVRTKEMRDVVWAEIDFRRGIIVRDKHKAINQTEDPLPRIIGLDRPTLRFLGNLYRNRRPGQLNVFVNCYGTSWDRHTFARHMNRWGSRLGLNPTEAKLSAYCFRHAYGCAATEAGVGERQLADLMGHSDTRMVSYYAQTAGKIEHLKRNAAKAMERLRGACR
jgi:integrase